ncbi:MAG: HAMP domain-containing histidine kinase [Bacteroidetes bacterium]|nr:HAMP domain-containing histidine kinase [Bacteroidota bacterium]
MMKDDSIINEYNKRLPALILNHYHFFITIYILILIGFCFTDFYIREIPELILTRIAPISLGIVLLIIKFSNLKHNGALVITINNLFCISLLIMIFTILIITFYTPVFKSSIIGIVVISISVYFLVKGKKSILLVYSVPLLFIILYLVFFIHPSVEQTQELMNPLAIYIGIFTVSFFTEKSRIKEFGLLTKLKEEKEKTQKLLLEKQDQNKLLSKQKSEIEVSRNQLEELNTNKDRFFSILAHDLRGPMAAFSGHLEFLSDDYPSYTEEEKIQLFKEINKSTKRLYNLLDNLLEWSRLQIKAVSFTPEKIGIKDIITSAINNTIEQAKNKQITINFTIDQNHAVYCDINMIDSTLRNLIGNAIKFSHEKSQIDIHCTDLNQQIKISVIDRGVGLSEEDQSKLFRIEKYISNPGTKKEAGTGLGLILCKEFVEQNGGKIWVESELNKGSAFTFTLPRIP